MIDTTHYLFDIQDHSSYTFTMKKEALINWFQHFRFQILFKHTSGFPMLRSALACLMACLFVGIVQFPLAAQEKPKESGPPTRTIYLTFDDGPLEGSEEINDAVRREKIKINVFVVGLNMQYSKRLQKYLHLYETNSWIEVGNHSFSHAHDSYSAFYSNPDTVLQDFLNNEKTLHLANKLARLPGRNMWRLNDRRVDDVRSGSRAADTLFSNGFKVFGWDLEWCHDPKSGVPIQTVDDMIHLIEQYLSEKRTVTENHLVILCHDEMFRKSWEESELKQLIGKLRIKGFKFGHLSEYP
jgi:peptidoglycan/xylan/chitin deacetylase (PgdA/CDA1 family)